MRAVARRLQKKQAAKTCEPGLAGSPLAHDGDWRERKTIPSGKLITMTALTRWNPFVEMEEMQDRLSSFFDWAPVRNGNQTPENEWAPLIDVIENPDEYLLRADLPGVSKNDLNVTLQCGELVIKGTRAAEQLAKGAQYVYSERPSGTFTRTFELPSNADAEHIQAEFKDGVLTVHVAKSEKARPRLIAIKGE